MTKEVLILGIESSCDETSVAVVRNGREILSNVVASQIKSHMRFGGVVPEVASRHHVEQMTQVVDYALEEAGVTMEEMNAVAVTKGPGLVGALLVGITAAKTLAMIYNLPLIGVNHLAGHIYASQLTGELQFPLLSLIASGGHTELVYMVEDGSFEVIGETQDDAVGEAYDKVGRLMDLPYPAGKYLDQLAHEGQATYTLPRAMMYEDHLDFSFSGMKSAVMNLVHNTRQRGETIDMPNLAASFQEAVVEILVHKTDRALSQYPVRAFVLAGGVAANSALRKGLQEMIKQKHPEVEVSIPPLSLCGDNAAMIAAAAYTQYMQQDFSDLTLNAVPGLML